MKSNLVFILLFSCLTYGCAVSPNSKLIGPWPTDYKEIIKVHVLRTYFNPYSLRNVKISTPTPGYLFFREGYIACLEAKADYRAEGYTGRLRRTAFLIKYGTVVYTLNNAAICNSAEISYMRWRELEEMSMSE